MNKPSISIIVCAALASLVATGCFSVKTESEIKPIHITMDINLKVDKELDKSFAEENLKKPKGSFVEVKNMLDRKVAGWNSKAMLEARPGATEDDKILIAETNLRTTRKIADIAKQSGVSVETVQKRQAKRIQGLIPEGSGVWFQDESGKWQQK